MQDSLFDEKFMDQQAVQTKHEEPTYKPACKPLRRRAYQAPMFSLDVMQDRSGRQGLGPLRLPVMQRGECERDIELRASGQASCAFLNCRYHLVGEALRIKDEEKAVAVHAARINGDLVHTCTLDFAEVDPEDDLLIGAHLGILRSNVPQRVAEAAFAMREMMKHDSDLEDLRVESTRKENK